MGWVNRFKFIDRLMRAIHPPQDHISLLTDEELAVKNDDLLERVKRLQATIDQEDGWFLCLTKSEKACSAEEGEVKNG